MNKKRLLWLCITAVWVCISAIYYSNYNFEDISLSIGDGKKVDYKIVNIPFFSFTEQRDFITIDSYDDICNEYIEKGVIGLKYEYNKKTYVVNKYRYFDIHDKFKYGTPVKIKLETKKDTKKCRFWVSVDPGKFNILLIGIVFGWIPLIMVLANIVIPILEYINKKIRKLF